MATIRKRGSRYNVQIRKEGYPSVTKTFTRISVAKKWASSTEADMERHLYIEAAGYNEFDDETHSHRGVGLA